MRLARGKVDNILVMGKSGAGKQPRIDVLVAEFGLVQLSTGNIFREFLGLYEAVGHPGPVAAFRDESRGTFRPDREILAALGQRVGGRDPAGVVLGAKAKFFVESGKFVPDELTNELFASYFSRSGCRGTVLDGYPRTVDQSRYLMELTGRHRTRLDAILLVEGDDEAIVARTIGRRICPACKRVFHLQHKPPREGRLCTECGAEVVLRSDDSEAKIRSRLEEFRTKTLPALELLQGRGVPVARVPGNLPVFTEEAVRRSVLDALADPA